MLIFQGKSTFIGCFDGTIREIVFEEQSDVHFPCSSQWKIKAKVASFTLTDWKEEEFIPNEALTKYYLMERDPQDKEKIWATDLFGRCYLMKRRTCEIGPFSLETGKVNKIFIGKERLFFWSCSNSNWLFNPENRSRICISTLRENIQLTSVCELPNGLIVVGCRCSGSLILHVSSRRVLH